jgi:hypothetical protein
MLCYHHQRNTLVTSAAEKSWFDSPIVLYTALSSAFAICSKAGSRLNSNICASFRNADGLQGVDWLVFVALNIAPCVVVQLCGTYQRSLGYGDAQASGQGLWHHKKQGGEVGGPAAAALI